MEEFEKLQEGLTEPQRQAVAHVEGPMLVLAGPGSGKTTVVTRRVAWLIGQGIPPWQILALTFTNKAAGEMRHRVDDMLPADLAGRRGLTISTFHSFCVRLLRRYGDVAGVSPQFSVYDAADQRDALKRAIGRCDLSTKNWAPASVASTISNAKNRLLDAEAFANEASDFYARTIARIYRAYEGLLRDNQALDFDDLLLVTANMLRSSDAVARELQDRYQYIMIDEFQDTNHAQFVLAHALACAHGNICVVGDPDQSIYGWRGADIRNILEFEQHYPAAKTVPLGRNFRSTGHIVEAAATLIANNKRRKAKVLSTELGDGEKPTVIMCRDEHHEARVIVDEFRKLREEQDLPWKSMAVLYRINALSRVLEEVFRDAQVPYVIARGTAFYERKEIKDALAYLRLLANPFDEVSLRRIINEPTRGVGKTTLQRIDAYAMAHHLRLAEALPRAAEVPDLSTRAVAAVDTFVAMVDRWRIDCSNEPAGGQTLSALVERVVRESGLEGHYKKARSEEELDRLANLEELISAASEFRLVEEPDPADGPGAPVPPAAPTTLDQLRGYLESVTLVSDADAVDPERGSITLMTLHTAKGLEYDAVAIAGLESGLLPHSRAAADENEMEEERRLCFVGITRAKRHLMLTRAAVRTHRGLRERTIVSPFIDELPPTEVVVSDLAAEDVFDPYVDDDPYLDHDDRTVGAYHVGCRVTHPTFGPGRIEALTPRPSGSAARVAFDRGGVKTLILEYAKLRVET